MSVQRQRSMFGTLTRSVMYTEGPIQIQDTILHRCDRNEIAKPVTGDPHVELSIFGEVIEGWPSASFLSSSYHVFHYPVIAFAQ